MAEGIQGCRAITRSSAVCPPPRGQRILNETLRISRSDRFSNESVISPPRVFRKGIAVDDGEDCYTTEITVDSAI